MHVVRGTLTANGCELFAGDALMVTEDVPLELLKCKAAEVLVFDLPGPQRQS